MYQTKIAAFFFFLLIVFGSICLPQKKRILSINYRTQSLPFGLKEKVPVKKPIVALALSGGGARGLSQIGVLKAFEKAGIHIDVIVGTSMGSIIGGLYAAGYSVAQIDSIAKNTDWNELLTSNRETDRRQLFVDQKVTEDRAIFTLRLNGFKPILPTSFNDGQKLSNYLSLLAFQAPIHVKNSFDELYVHFRAVTTNLVTGNLVAIDKGSLSQALRASSSVSFFLAPVNLDSMTLVDGGLVANIPVDAAKKISDYVIAVNTTSTLHNEEELNLPWVVADQIVSIPMRLLNEKQINDADINIEPNLTNNSSTDFANIDDLIERGYRAALPYVKKIRHELDSIYNSRLVEKEFYIKNIVSENIASNTDVPLVGKFTGQDSVSSSEILKEIYDKYQTGEYSDVKAEIDENEDYSTIRFIYKKNPIVKDIIINGINIIQPEEVDSILYPLYNSPYNQRRLCEKLINILSLYREKGFSLADVNQIEFNNNTGVLYLTFDEGMISEIKIEGNEITDPTVITREIPLKKGEYFRYQPIEQALLNLRTTNLFQNINLSVVCVEDQNILEVKVHEKVNSLMRVGFRIDDEKKAQLGLDLRNENIFGSGNELGLILFGGTRNRAYILELKSNRILNTYLTYKFNAYYKFEDTYNYGDDSVVESNEFSRSVIGEYRQIYYGGSVAVGAQVGKFGNLIIKGEYEFDRIKLKQGMIPGDPATTKIISLRTSTTIDTQDKYPYPNQGVYFNAYYETAQKVFGGDVGYVNFGFDYRNYITINDVSTFSPRLVMGFADKTLPLTKQYSLGGQSSFFGMRQDDFRGRQILLASLEYRFKLPFDIFFDTYFKARYDLGKAWEEQEQIRLKDLRHGIGVSLAFDTPVGPAEFSVEEVFCLQKIYPAIP